MLKAIRIQGTFRHDNSFFEFKDGLTSITGRNGRGKSMIPEMIQFAFWGASVLRGVNSDYPELKVTLWCFIKGKAYTIVRTINKAEVILGHELDGPKLATSTKAVNGCIAGLFGYSKEVFQVANAINQKQVDEFCKILPTARKKLVDETIGLSALDDLTKWIEQNLSGLKALVKVRAELMVVPVEPTNPNLGFDYEFYKKQAFEFNEVRNQRTVVKALAEKVLVAPTPVELEPDDANWDQYMASTDAYKLLLGEAGVLAREIVALGTLPPLVDHKLEADDDRLEEYRTSQLKEDGLRATIARLTGEIARIKDPARTEEQLQEMEARKLLGERWDKKQELIEAGVHYHCDNCQHDGTMVDPRVEDEFKDVPMERPNTSDIPGAEWRASQRLLIAQAARKVELQTELAQAQADFDAVPKTTSRINVIVDARAKVAGNAELARKHTRLEELNKQREDLTKRFEASPDKSKDVERLAQKRETVRTYAILLERYKADLVEVQNAQARLALFSPELDQASAVAESNRDAALVYETNIKAYKQAKELYDAASKEQEVKHAEIAEWEKGKGAIVDLRQRIKGYLLPSLNKVASYLVSEFSGGELSNILIDDDFEVLVNGKRVETLSGGQKTITNLAIRIGLGQVLTNRVFSVLMMDEPDESCDDEVAGLLEKTFVALRSNFKQILLITHKSGGEADHNIHLV